MARKIASSGSAQKPIDQAWINQTAENIVDAATPFRRGEMSVMIPQPDKPPVRKFTTDVRDGAVYFVRKQLQSVFASYLTNQPT